MGNIPIVVLVVMAANGIFSYLGFNDRGLFNKYKFHIGAIQGGEKVRMFSSGFLHGDWMHLLFNMYSLFVFGPLILINLSRIDFLIIYLGSLLIGNILSFFFHKNEYNYSAIGASGAVSGIIYSAILIDPMRDYQFLFLPNIDIPGFLLGLIFMGYSIYGMRSNSDNIGHDAHFGGAVGGYLLTLMLMPSLLQTSMLMVGLLAIPIIILYFLIKSGKFNE